MRITHIVSTFSPEHGGPTQEIGNLCEAQSLRGHEITLYTLNGFSATSSPRTVKGVAVQKSFRVLPPQILGFSFDLARRLRCDSTPDIYHIHGVWHLAQIAGCREAQRRRVPYIYHLMGGFTAYELNRKAARKRLARWLYQDVALRRAACLHVNGDSEARFLREQGFTNPIAVLPVGVDVSDKLPTPASAANRIAKDVNGRRILLYLARVHPTKGIEILLEAWQQLAPKFPEWLLLVAGSGDSAYTAKIHNQALQWGLGASVLFVGQVTETEKAWCYQNASVYVLPSFQENFGNTVAEALSYGVPVITTTWTPWAELKAERSGWLCEPTSENLVETIQQCLYLSNEQLRNAGRRGRELVARKYGLESVLTRLEGIYEWLMAGGLASSLTPGDVDL